MAIKAAWAIETVCVLGQHFINKVNHWLQLCISPGIIQYVWKTEDCHAYLCTSYTAKFNNS